MTRQPAAVGYPEWLEQWWLAYARDALGTASVYQALTRLRSPLRALSERFFSGGAGTRDDYWRDAAFRAAYGLFFFPQMYARMQIVLHEAHAYHGWRPRHAEPLRIWDLGSGPGAAGLAAVLYLAGAFPGRPMELFAVDRSEAALDLYRLLAEEAHRRGYPLDLQVFVGDLRCWPAAWRPGPAFDLWLASFSLTEALHAWKLTRWTVWLEQAMDAARTEGLGIIVEPATRAAATRLEQLRDRLASRSSLTVWAPCPHRRPCPMLREGRFLCHQVRRWALPEAVEYLNRRLHREAHVIKYAYLILARMPAPRRGKGTGWTGRLVAPVVRAKGRVLTRVCAEDGRLYELQIPLRNMPPERRSDLLQWERGDVVAFDPGVAPPPARLTLPGDRLRRVWGAAGRGPEKGRVDVAPPTG